MASVFRIRVSILYESVSRLLGTKSHKKYPEVQDEYGVKYRRYWYNEETGMVFCLAEASNKEAAETMHQEAHGLTAD